MCEGVIKFQADHQNEILSDRRYGALRQQLSGWRQVFRKLELIGQTPDRYDGAGFGNLSARVGAPSSARGRRSLLITGTQSGGIGELRLEGYCVVHDYHVGENRVRSSGLAQPSSETLTHATLYDLSPAIRFVFHVHCAALWKQRTHLRIPTTPEDIPYGTQGMARAVERLYRQGPAADLGILAMGGHEDGIIAFGKTADTAGLVLTSFLARASQIDTT